MDSTTASSPPVRDAGYLELTRRFGLDVIPNWHRSRVVGRGPHRIEHKPDGVEEFFPASYWPGDTLGDHLEFALKYDGTHPAILARIFSRADEAELVAFLRRKPTGIYARRLWFWYERLTGRALPLPDLKQGNYVPLLDPETYYTCSPGRRVRRQRVDDNLTGTPRFCPMIRKTPGLARFEGADLAGRVRRTVAAYPVELVKRALAWLYTKETRSSFELERITPGAGRVERFAALLELAHREDFCEKDRLIELQNRIVDARFADADYRESQNYVGETVNWKQERIHYVTPRPEDLPDLMAGWIDAHRRMGEAELHPVIHAAAVAWGFVFLHPFEDGNGRIHRFLIHHVLARRGFTPDNVMFPVSATMLKAPADYDASLEAFSKPLMGLLDYRLDEAGRMTVLSDTAIWYRFPDLTAQAEALFSFIERTIDQELVPELEFLSRYEATRAAAREIVDLPDRLLDLFIRFCLQNHGRLSAAKRASHFPSLTDDEVFRLERAVQASMPPEG
jgi:hypothetical protein